MASTTGYRKGSKSHRDIYAEVTDTIIAELEKGTAPWVRPWHAAGGYRRRRRCVSNQMNISHTRPRRPLTPATV